MNSKNLGLQISGTIFGIVAVMHLLRIFTGITVIIGSHSLPVWMNIAGFLATGALCVWLWTLTCCKTEKKQE